MRNIYAKFKDLNVALVNRRFLVKQLSRSCRPEKLEVELHNLAAIVPLHRLSRQTVKQCFFSI